MEEIQFKPKYEKGLYGTIPIIVLFLVLSIWELQTGIIKEKWLWLIVPFLFASLFLMPFAIIKRITLRDFMVIERYFVGPKIIHYEDVLDIGMITIKTKHGNISLFKMTNCEEFKQILFNRINFEKTNKIQIEGVLLGKEIEAYSVLSISFIILSILALLMYITGFHIHGVNIRLLIIPLFFVVFFGTYFTMKLMNKINKSRKSNQNGT